MKRPAARSRAADTKRPKAKAQKGQENQEPQREGPLPVSTLCGFLGAGKTTLLKHILEKKHQNGDFKCAVIVNDMAEVNIDKALIDQTALLQSDEVVAMQNGCVCCTLKDDLAHQILGLARRGSFDYMIVEASGVSEPSQIARIFSDDHEGRSHEGLSEVARLDTCVTVVDCGDFFANLEGVKKGPKNESFPQLLAEQIEYANVVVLNKTDLVSKSQLQDISDQVGILNPKARVLQARQSRIDVMQVVDTKLYKPEDFQGWKTHGLAEAENDEGDAGETWMASCCLQKAQKGEAFCCAPLKRQPSTKSRGISDVILAPAARQTRHEIRFGITSFLYRARRPFHPVRFDETFVEKFFVLHETDAESKAQSDAATRRSQAEAAKKKRLREETFGGLLRSKGFLWLANRHDLMGIFSQAGNMLTIQFPERWLTLQSAAWEGSEAERATICKDFHPPFGDRRQDMVFIGKDLKHEKVQQILDSCLLTDEEMAMGIDGWKATMGDVFLDASDDEN